MATKLSAKFVINCTEETMQNLMLSQVNRSTRGLLRDWCDVTCELCRTLDSASFDGLFLQRINVCMWKPICSQVKPNGLRAVSLPKSRSPPLKWRSIKVLTTSYSFKLNLFIFWFVYVHTYETPNSWYF